MGFLAQSGILFVDPPPHEIARAHRSWPTVILLAFQSKNVLTTGLENSFILQGAALQLRKTRWYADYKQGAPPELVISELFGISFQYSMWFAKFSFVFYLIVFSGAFYNCLIKPLVLFAIWFTI